MAKRSADKFIPCTIKTLPPVRAIEAAACACRHNPANRPAIEAFAMLGIPKLKPDRLAVLTTKWWGSGGVRLSVSFMDGGSSELRRRILEHMNEWSQYSNVSFEETGGTGQVRIARTPGEGYYSYSGTDIEFIDVNSPTMNFDSFTMSTPESEFRRVVPHEAWHTCGGPHEHLRRELVEEIDPQAAIDYFARTNGWDRSTTVQNVLTPLEEYSIYGTPGADQDSIMAYYLPGEITRSGRPIRGGDFINANDADFAGRIFPLSGVAKGTKA